MDKNLRNALRLAGLLTEQDDPMGGGAGPGAAPGGDAPSPDASGAGAGPDAGGPGGDDPASMIDQAIDLLNKIKSALGGGAGAPPAGGPGAGGPPPGP